MGAERVGLISALVSHFEATTSGFRQKDGNKYVMMKIEKVLGIIFFVLLSIVLGIMLAWWFISSHMIEALEVVEPDYTVTTLHVVPAVSYTDSGDAWDIQPAAGYKVLNQGEL